MEQRFARDLADFIQLDGMQTGFAGLDGGQIVKAAIHSRVDRSPAGPQFAIRVAMRLEHDLVRSWTKGRVGTQLRHQDIRKSSAFQPVAFTRRLRRYDDGIY